MKKINKVYITGIGGTVGTAFTKYLYGKYEIFGIDSDEGRLGRIKTDCPAINVKIGRCNMANLKDMDVVIHLAATKSVDLCEVHPGACVENNVLQTFLLFEEARRRNVDILFMSTDKAVEPISVYGYAKALGEHLTRDYGGAFVRSGNIIASNASVFDFWDRALDEGKPLKVTHKDMKRYFVSADNVVKRIWEAYLKGEREIIPEMDKEVKLMDLVKEKLDERGLKNYPIEFIGLRPGEKLVEKLEWSGDEQGI